MKTPFHHKLAVVSVLAVASSTLAFADADPRFKTIVDCHRAMRLVNAVDTVAIATYDQPALEGVSAVPGTFKETGHTKSEGTKKGLFIFENDRCFFNAFAGKKEFFQLFYDEERKFRFTYQQGDEMLPRYNQLTEEQAKSAPNKTNIVDGNPIKFETAAKVVFEDLKVRVKTLVGEDFEELGEQEAFLVSKNKVSKEMQEQRDKSKKAFETCSNIPDAKIQGIFAEALKKYGVTPSKPATPPSSGTASEQTTTTPPPSEYKR